MLFLEYKSKVYFFAYNVKVVAKKQKIRKSGWNMGLDANLINPFLAASKNVIAATTGIQTTIGKPC